MFSLGLCQFGFTQSIDSVSPTNKDSVSEFRSDFTTSYLYPDDNFELISDEDKIPIGSLQIVTYNGNKFFVYRLYRNSKKIHLEGYNLKGKPLYSSLERFVKSALADSSIDLDFAINAGMYHGDGTPVGIFTTDRKELYPIDTQYTNPNELNFYMQPNGVFFSYEQKPGRKVWNVMTTKEYVNFQKKNKIIDATQSGPMLISDCLINSAFGLKSVNKKIRNGVGASKDFVYLVMSFSEINFFNMALFMKHLGVENGLYLDGVVSQFYYHPKRKYFGSNVPIGPIISVYE